MIKMIRQCHKEKKSVSSKDTKKFLVNKKNSLAAPINSTETLDSPKVSNAIIENTVKESEKRKFVIFKDKKNQLNETISKSNIDFPKSTHTTEKLNINHIKLISKKNFRNFCEYKKKLFSGFKKTDKTNILKQFKKILTLRTIKISYDFSDKESNYNTTESLKITIANVVFSPNNEIK
ncbi:hypothetical protein EDEG_01021 [Edhazardia aedis USNM 41457]|uniref:Uncharacterized protein n=1 Tax=Edhazardia aedis (strain USNM 41457) TaxID=1003232 RepID=J9DBC8_EDHAE|nr:hypothetical protein EDEG_01021 [Edhazardia aedis USNM 41457]|eukprot:EJW04799.1 hypothetical protein EDEG_01021 [Edhazardia aedis USNM 41457]